uniref:Uridine-cytidine kinase n=1 Tax=Marmota marmota marmota TaxID=9994 RepID=A0A8C5Z3R3_MARMA
MAIQVLLDHGIDLEKISVVVYLATEVGIRRILNAFDNKVNIFAGMIISREKLQNHQYKWALTRFFDSKYFGCSGKTSVAAKIVSSINVPWTVLISLDNFYNPLGPEDRARAFKNEYDFDEPNAINLDLAYKCILNLKEGKRTNIPVYSFVHHNRVPDKNIVIYGASVVVIEGIYALYDRRLLDLMDLKIYVDADLDVCLARRLSRDIVSRGRDLDGCIQQWEKFVKPNAVKFVKPTMKNADAIIPSMSDNATAVNLIINHIKSKLELKSNEHLRELIKLGSSPSQDVLNQFLSLASLSSSSPKEEGSILTALSFCLVTSYVRFTLRLPVSDVILDMCCYTRLLSI